MSKLRLNIDGREVIGFEGQTILDIAREHGIDIPTLCHDERVEIFGSCGLCSVEAEGNPKLLRSCSTFAAEGMIIRTDSEKIRLNRQSALELLLSDHRGDCRPPCMLECPAQTDCQGYVGLIANGEYHEALKLIKDKIPLPASIGRVCPHPCEEACRRELVEEPVSIAALKSFVGDLGMEYMPDIAPSTGKKVAIIGGGPGGLTAAYFLRIQGHGAAVYDAMPHMGGMLRYGIPEYRLPKKLLQEEIHAIEKMGVEFHNNIKIGRDLTLDYLRNTYDAVVVAVGAWTSSGLGCPGEGLEGVRGGIDFLRDVALNNPVFTGRKIAVVGGGNTAMDACRTSVRLGADRVYNIYRRTRNEMPAEEIEIIEAEEEGVIFKNLTNPIEIVGAGGKVSAVRLQVMELGEPDASGRRSPVPVPGKEEIIEIDAIIIAIGQKLDPLGIEELTRNKWGSVIADERSFRTNLEGVFAIGDATNNGADIAITAIGEAKRAAGMIDKYLHGEELKFEEPYFVKDEKTSEDFSRAEKLPRAKMPHRPADKRRKDFLEINFGLCEEEARREAARCLECGCHDYFECKLIEYANQYNVRPEKYEGKTHNRAQEDDHPFIRRNPDKCILCGLCVRICDEVVGATAIGLVGRGFDTIIEPALDVDLRGTDCISCGQCVHVCPTGALSETMMTAKQVPLKETFTETVCSFCSVGCESRLSSSGNLLTRSLPLDNKNSLLCVKGRFGFGELAKKERLIAPLIKGEKVSFGQAVIHANKSLQSLQTQYGDCVAVAVSDRYTNEEAFLIKEYASKALKTDKAFSFGQTRGVLDASTATFDELENTELIVAAAPGIMENSAVAGMRIKRAVNKGAKLLLLSSGEESLLDSIATLRIDLSLLPGIAAALQEKDKSNEAAEMITKAKKTVFIFVKNSISEQAARLIVNIAVLSGRSHGPRNGVIQLLPGANSQGLINLGIKPREEFLRAINEGEIRGLFIFGENVPQTDLSALDFLAVQDLHMTETAKQACVVFPAASFAETHGSFTATDGITRNLNPAIPCPLEQDNIGQIKALSAHAGWPMPYRDIADIRQAMSLIAPDRTELRLMAAEGGETPQYSEMDTDGLRAGFMGFMAEKGLVK